MNILLLVTAAKEVHWLDACLKIQRMFIGRLVVGLTASILIFVSEKEPLQKHTDNPLKSKRMQYGCGTASY